MPTPSEIKRQQQRITDYLRTPPPEVDMSSGQPNATLTLEYMKELRTICQEYLSVLNHINKHINEEVRRSSIARFMGFTRRFGDHNWALNLINHHSDLESSLTRLNEFSNAVIQWHESVITFPLVGDRFLLDERFLENLHGGSDKAIRQIERYEALIRNDPLHGRSINRSSSSDEEREQGRRVKLSAATLLKQLVTCMYQASGVYDAPFSSIDMPTEELSDVVDAVRDSQQLGDIYNHHNKASMGFLDTLLQQFKERFSSEAMKRIWAEACTAEHVKGRLLALPQIRHTATYPSTQRLSLSFPPQITQQITQLSPLQDTFKKMLDRKSHLSYDMGYVTEFLITPGAGSTQQEVLSDFTDLCHQFIIDKTTISNSAADQINTNFQLIFKSDPSKKKNIKFLIPEGVIKVKTYQEDDDDTLAITFSHSLFKKMFDEALLACLEIDTTTHLGVCGGTSKSGRF